jgi:lipopolysaccharide export system permease protein
MTLFKYILKDFFKYVTGTVVLCLFLFTLFDFIHKSGKYIATYKPATKYLVQFYIFQMPALFVQVLPIAALLASVICMVLLSRTNEITAMRAAGMSPMRVGMPIAVGGGILCLLSFLVGEGVTPIASNKMRFIESVLIEGEKADESADLHWTRRGNQLFHFEEYDAISKKLISVRIIETGLNFRPKQTLEAKEAVYLPETEDWLLTGIKVLYFNPNGTLAYTERRETQIEPIPVEPRKLQKERRKPNELGLLELWESVSKGKEAGLNVSINATEMHFKFAYYFAAFVVCLMGLKFGYKSERTVETAGGVLLAVAIGIGYYFIFAISKSAGRDQVPPFLAAWTANFIIGGIGAYQIWRAKKAT